jgi:hypothetical protein
VQEQEELVTCADLRQLAKKSGIRCKDTTRLYWGTYGYCLKALINPKWIEQRHQEVCDFWDKSQVVGWNKAQPSIRQIQRKYKERVNEFVEDFIEKNGSIFEMDEFYSQITQERISFYVKSAEIAARLVENNRRFFAEMWTPKDATVEARLGDYANTHMQVKNHLWYARYDYKVDFKQERCFDSLDERVGLLYLSESFYSISPYNRTLYLLGEDEYFLVKLALKDKIAKVSCCTLNSEAEGEVIKKAI